MSWVHLHLATNHVPVLGTFFVGLLFVTALLRRSDELQRLSLWAFVILTLVSIPIKFTGDFAYDQVRQAEWISTKIAEQHEQSADQATTGIFLLGVFSVVGLVLSRKGRSTPRWVSITILVLAGLTFALMARAANLGGQLRHEEIRPAVTVPVDDQDPE